MANAQVLKPKVAAASAFPGVLQTPQAAPLPPATPYRHHDLLKSNDGKSTKEILMEGDHSYTTSEMQQQVSVLDMEQSLSKIDKIDEETEDEGTCSRVQNDAELIKDCNNSMVICDQESKDQLSIIESRVTLP